MSSSVSFLFAKSKYHVAKEKILISFFLLFKRHQNETKKMLRKFSFVREYKKIPCDYSLNLRLML